MPAPQPRPAVAPAARRLPPAILLLLTSLLAAAGAAAALPGETPAGPSDAPADVRRLLDEAGGAEAWPDADAVVVLEATEVDVEDSGLSHVVTRSIAQALTAAGARDLGFLRLDYDPATQAVEVLRLRLHREDGGHEDLDPALLADVAAPAHAIYWGARMKALDLPALRAGDAVESIVYRKGFQIAYLGQDEQGGEAEDDERYVPPMRGHFYDVVQFQGARPIVEKTYELRTPRDKPVQYAVYNGEVFAAASFDDFTNTYRFWKREVPAATHEWRSPGESDYAPKVVLATVGSWQEKSRWFAAVNDGQFAADDAIRAKVAELTRGLKNDEARIAAINHWVAQEIRYCGLNMGKGEGYTLHPGPMIYRERSGVCKDIAGMTITMLRAAGYDVWPAMTMAGARVESVPADQFNHCVAALRRPDGTFEMLDPTWIPFDMTNWSYAEGEQHYVIGTPEGEELSVMPAYTSEDNRADLEIRAKIRADGTLAGTLRYQGRGQSDGRVRRGIGNSPKAAVERGLRDWVAQIAPGAELVSWRWSDPRDLGKPLQLEVEFAVPGYAQVGERELLWQPVGPRLLLANYAGAFRFVGRDLSEERKTPCLIWYPQLVRIDERVELPRGWRAAEPDNWEAGGEEEVATLTSTFQARGARLDCSATVDVRARTIEPERWAGYQGVLAELEDVAESHLSATREGK